MSENPSSPLPLPTDSLYKFQALSGLASLLFMLWFFAGRIHTELMEIAKFEGDREILKEEINSLLNEKTNVLTSLGLLETNVYHPAQYSPKLQNTLSNALSVATNILAHVPTNQSYWDLQVTRLLEIKEQIKDLGEHSRKVGMKNAEMNAKLILLRASNEELRFLKWSAVWAFIGGTLWTVAGFASWYLKIQIYQDRILYNEANTRAPKIRKAKKELD